MIPNKLIDKYITLWADPRYRDILELEIRFKSYHGDFGTGVSRRAFNRILNKFIESGSIPQVTNTTDYIGKGIRKTVSKNPKTNVEEAKWQKKTRVAISDVKDYRLRYAISLEQDIAPVPGFSPESIRSKKRTSFNLGKSRLDLTVVNMFDAKQNIPLGTNYEVELEVVDSSLVQEQTFQHIISTIMQLLHDTRLIYTLKDYRDVMIHVNKTLGGANPFAHREKDGTMKKQQDWIIDSRVLFQARNLKAPDIVSGGLALNKYETYRATHKTDGLRKLLVVHETGLWLVMAPDEANKLTNFVPNKQGIGYIVEGELVPMDKRLPKVDTAMSKKRVNSIYWFLVFDTLAIPGQGRFSSDRGIQLKKHSERMMTGQHLVDIINNWSTFITNFDKLLAVNTKTFKGFKTPDDFFHLMSEMFREQPYLSYENDGFILMPENMPYYSWKGKEKGSKRSDRLPLYMRKLTKRPDICKWKPQDDLTIDFAIQWKATPSGTKLILLVGERQGKLSVFEGTSFNPLGDNVSNKSQDGKLVLTPELTPSGTVVEFKWLISATDPRKGTLVPVRLRTDKNRPNGRPFAEDTWDLNHRSILESTLKGEDLILMRRYFNRVKRQELFSEDVKRFRPDKQRLSSPFYKQTSTQVKPTILGIGTGNGGDADASKWGKYSRIVSVEPDSLHIEEQKRRLITHGLSDRVKIVQTGGEDTNTIVQAVREWIPGGKVDTVSLMLSLSFFWQSEAILDQLIQTIVQTLKPGGQVIFMTINGDAVKEIFDPTFGNALPITELKLGQADLKYYPKKRQLDIDIKGTIVNKQTEWLVFINDLRLKLGSYGFGLLWERRSDKEKFLSPAGLQLSKMYSYGIFGPTDNPVTEKSKMIPNTVPTFMPPTALPPITQIGPIINPGKTPMTKPTPQTQGFPLQGQYTVPPLPSIQGQTFAIPRTFPTATPSTTQIQGLPPLIGTFPVLPTIGQTVPFQNIVGFPTPGATKKTIR